MKHTTALQPNGFTLLETLFAVLIFSAALISLMTIAGRGIAAANTAKDQVISYYLAQEGLEVVRNIRDSNFISGNDWMDGLNDCIGDTCNIDDEQGAPVLVSCTVCAVNQNGEVLPFTRKISLEERSNDEYLVTTTVTWNAKGIDRSVVLQTILKKWYGIQ